MRRAVVLGVALSLSLAACTDVVEGTGRSTRSASTPVTSGAGFADAARVSEVLAATRAGIVALNSYDYRDLDTYEKRGVAVTTGKLRDDFLNTARSVVAKAAPGKKAVQAASVDEAGIGQVTGDRATALVFGKLSIRTIDTGGKARIDPFRIVIGLERVAGTWKLSQVSLDGTLDVVPDGSAGLTAAVRAARRCTANLLSFRRAHFAADYARALDCTTGSLRTDIVGKRVATLRTITDGRFDLFARARAVAVVDAQGSRIVALVVLDGTRSTDSGRPTRQGLRVTLIETGAEWRLSNVTLIGA